MTAAVPLIAITTPELEMSEYSTTSSPQTPESPTIFDIVKEMPNADSISKYDTVKENHELPDTPTTIRRFYRQKCILMTGATGFIGKAVLWKLLQSLVDSIDKIIIVFRQHKYHSPQQRLQQDILSNIAFVNLRRSVGATAFDEFIHDRLYPVFGDLAEPNLGLSQHDLQFITSRTNIIYHCAGFMNESLEESVKVNTFGTLQLITLAKNCHMISAFIHLSLLQKLDVDEQQLYPLPNNTSAIELLNDILNTPNDTAHINYRPFYENAFLFSKSLAEHILVSEVIKNKQDGSEQFPIAILRLRPVGPSIQEPLIGWTDSVSGINGVILMSKRGQRVVPPDSTTMDIIPVDYVARFMIGCAITLDVSKDYTIPKAATEREQQLKQPQQSQQPQPQRSLPSEYRKNTRNSATISNNRSSVRNSLIYQTKLFSSTSKSLPVIFHLSSTSMRPMTWKEGHEAMYRYWSTYPTPARTRFTHVDADAKRKSWTLEKSASLLLSTTDLLYSAYQGDASNAAQVMLRLSPHFEFTSVVPEDADHAFWHYYVQSACFGVHHFLCGEKEVRTPRYGWSVMVQDPVFVESVLFSPDQVRARQKRMVVHLKQLVMYQDAHTDDVWLSDLDDALEDWCQLQDETYDRHLGKWRKKANDESITKIVVLNDRRVNSAIHQITQAAGVPKQTAVNEALKILVRMSERTQLAFVKFTHSLLTSLLEDMFDSVCVSEDQLRLVRQATMGKRVVYVPVLKSVLDLLVVWYMAMRYQLPLPALACDESMSALGPVSDVYRLAGAFYVKRDTSARSPLNSAVLAAYTQVLLRDHGALAFCLERARTRTGKLQEAYNDGFVDMVVESTIGSEHRKSFKDVVFLPINITYENVPELEHLVDEALDQPTQKTRLCPRSKNTMSLERPLRPSEAKGSRKSIVEAPDTLMKYSRVLIGIGSIVSVQEVADEHNKTSVRDSDYINKVSQLIKQKISHSQKKALVVSPVSLVSAIILYGRATHGITIKDIKHIMEWVRYKVVQNGYSIDWQKGEDIDTIVLATIKLLNTSKNFIIDGKEINDDTNIRVNDHADNVMVLSYYANQIIHILLLDCFFAIVYLSFSKESILEDEFADRFVFLVQLLEKEFLVDWDLKEKLNVVIESYTSRQIIQVKDQRLYLLVSMENDPGRYERLMFLASLIYPTIDAYWITSCSLSALEAVPMLPRCIIPLLTQWIATHLITGRRTIYREVLSTESSKTALEVFMTMQFLTDTHAKEKLSPDAQILLHELGVPTSEILIGLHSEHSIEDDTSASISPSDPDGVMKAMMAQIHLNRATSNMADLCQQINLYRLDAASPRESFQNAQVFQKCLKQIRGILQLNPSFAKRRKIQLTDNEERLVQLVYSLLASNVATGVSQARSLHRISETYSLR